MGAVRVALRYSDETEEAQPHQARKEDTTHLDTEQFDQVQAEACQVEQGRPGVDANQQVYVRAGQVLSALS